ncbi:hypothetical protein ACQYE5_000694 [Enterobacter cancerogenus]
MPKVYVIVDTKMNVDSFMFMQQTNGAAASYFYNWCLLQNHRDFALHSIIDIDFNDNVYMPTDMTREHICDMPSEDDNNANHKG